MKRSILMGALRGSACAVLVLLGVASSGCPKAAATAADVARVVDCVFQHDTEPPAEIVRDCSEAILALDEQVVVDILASPGHAASKRALAPKDAGR